MPIYIEFRMCPLPIRAELMFQAHALMVHEVGCCPDDMQLQLIVYLQLHSFQHLSMLSIQASLSPVGIDNC